MKETEDSASASTPKTTPTKTTPTVQVTKPAASTEHPLVSVVCNLKDRVASYALGDTLHHFAIDEELEHALIARVEQHQAELAKPKAEG